MRRALVASAFAVAALAGCAALIDINHYDPPPAPEADADVDVDAGPPDTGPIEAGAPDACILTPDGGAQMLAATPLAVHLALDETDVYYGHSDPPRDSAILRCSKCGCQTPQQLAKLAQVGGLAVDDSFVFYTDYTETGSLNRLDKKTLEVQQIPNQISPFGVAVDGTYVYWTVIGSSDITTAGIWRAQKVDLGNATQLAKTQEDPDNVIPYAIAVDDTYVYYTTTPDLLDGNTVTPCMDNEAGPSHGTVRRVPKNATPPVVEGETLATAQPCPVGLAVDNSTVYWLNLGAGAALNGSVWSVPKGGPSSAGQQLIDGLGRPNTLALHAGRLYWPSPGYQRIETCLPAGCKDNVVTLSSRESNPADVAADDSAVYWVDVGTVANLFGDGALRRAPSPP